MSYCIKANYQSADPAVVAKHQGDHGDDTWQREVYETALLHVVARDKSGQPGAVVVDVGCGIGFKLLKYFAQYDTIGYEVPHMVDALRAKHPERQWRVCDLAPYDGPRPDVLICADVIEHVADPDALLAFIASTHARTIVISTPARDYMAMYNRRNHSGPPRNPAHVREWTLDEFGRYLRQRFTVVRHFISNRAQGTQCAVLEM